MPFPDWHGHEASFSIKFGKAYGNILDPPQYAGFNDMKIHWSTGTKRIGWDDAMKIASVDGMFSIKAKIQMDELRGFG